MFLIRCWRHNRMRRIKVSLSATVFASPNKGQGHFHFVSQSPRWPYKPYFTRPTTKLSKAGVCYSESTRRELLRRHTYTQCYYVDRHIRSKYDPRGRRVHCQPIVVRKESLLWGSSFCGLSVFALHRSIKALVAEVWMDELPLESVEVPRFVICYVE